jgi:hypothetical protein
MAMARPARLIKLRERSARPMIRMPVMMLKGMEMPMIRVGRRDIASPRSRVGRVLIRKANTTLMAKRNPRRPS